MISELPFGTTGHASTRVIFGAAALSRVTRERGNPWVTNNLNGSHLDYYYALLTVLAVANFVIFAVLAGRYKYKVESTETIEVDMDVKKIQPEAIA